MERVSALGGDMLPLVWSETMLRDQGTSRRRFYEFDAMPADYSAAMVHLVRSLATDGRGDDARGRHLASLYALEWACRNAAFTYRPSRDPARWLLLLMDVAGGRMGRPPEERVHQEFAAFCDGLRRIDLANVAQVTERTMAGSLARKLGAPPRLVVPLLHRMTMASILWSLGMPRVGPGGHEKHPQGRQIRKRLRKRIDYAWDAVLEALEAHRMPDAVDVLAAIPTSFEVTLATVDATLARVHERLESLPFAVYYALVTDARKGGRVWRPPAAYVEGGAYDREAFDATVGNVLEDSRSRKHRFDRRSVTLAEMGLSAAYPRAIARIDTWLKRWAMPPFSLDGDPPEAGGCDWYSWAMNHLQEIRDRHATFAQEFATRRRGDGTHAPQ